MTCSRSCAETGLVLLFFLILILCLDQKLSFVSLWLFRELVHQQQHNLCSVSSLSKSVCFESCVGRACFLLSVFPFHFFSGSSAFMSLAIFIEDNGSRQKNHKRVVLCQPSSLAHLNTICQVQLLKAPQLSLFQPPKELGLFTVSASQDGRWRTGTGS